MDRMLKVNPLPVLTWNKQKINSAELIWPEGLAAGVGPAGTELPETVRFAMLEDAEAWYAEHGLKYEMEAVVACKYACAADQSFPTGMGGGVDALLKECGAAARLYEIDGRGVSLRFDYRYADGDARMDSAIFHLKPGSEATVIEYYTAEPGSGFAGSVARAWVEEGASLRLIRLQMLPEAFVFADDLGARLEKDAKMEYTSMQLGSRRLYAGAYFDQWGEASEVDSGMAYLAPSGSFVDYNYVDCFRGKDTKGIMRFHGVMEEKSEKNARETLDFRKGCTGAFGDEEEDILAMGDDVVNKAIPMILGEEEDMSGRHAVTVGKLSPEMLYYMQSRGITRKTAEEMMIRSRIGQVSRRIPDPALSKAVEEYLDTLFGASADAAE